jgi:hypothetical protein
MATSAVLSPQIPCLLCYGSDSFILSSIQIAISESIDHKAVRTKEDFIPGWNDGIRDLPIQYIKLW